MTRNVAAFAVLSLWLAPCLPQTADAQVRRCETADGRTVYTDKACQDIGAVDRLQRDAGNTGASSHRRQCSRTLQDLTFELAMAIDARDANRLAGLYHWPGIGTRGGYAIMDRLDAIAQRPLVDARPLYPSDEPAMPMAPPPPVADVATDPSRPPSSAELMGQARPWRPSALALARSGAAPREGAAPPEDAPVDEPAPRRRMPQGLQVDQTLANGTTPSRTVFGLRRHLGCWWISF